MSFKENRMVFSIQKVYKMKNPSCKPESPITTSVFPANSSFASSCKYKAVIFCKIGNPFTIIMNAESSAIFIS